MYAISLRSLGLYITSFTSFLNLLDQAGGFCLLDDLKECVRL